MKLFSRLQEAVKRADMAKLREFLGEAVSKVVLRVSKRKWGDRYRYQMQGGKIHMNSADLSNAPD